MYAMHAADVLRVVLRLITDGPMEGCGEVNFQLVLGFCGTSTSWTIVFIFSVRYTCSPISYFEVVAWVSKIRWTDHTVRVIFFLLPSPFYFFQTHAEELTLGCFSPSLMVGNRLK